MIFSTARELYGDGLTNNRLQRFSKILTPSILRRFAKEALTNPGRSRRALEDLVEWAGWVMTKRKDLMHELASLNILVLNYWDEADRVYLANTYNRLRQHAEDFLRRKEHTPLKAHAARYFRDAITKHD